MRAPYRRLTKWERRIRAFRLWLYQGTDEKVLAAAFLFLLACIRWWRW